MLLMKVWLSYDREFGSLAPVTKMSELLRTIRDVFLAVFKMLQPIRFLETSELLLPTV